MRTAFWPAVQRWVIVSAESKIIRQLTGAAFISPGRLKFISFSIFSFIFCYFIHFYFFYPSSGIAGNLLVERVCVGEAVAWPCWRGKKTPVMWLQPAFFHSKKRYCTKPRRPLISEEDKRKLWKLVSFEFKNLTNFLFQV